VNTERKSQSVIFWDEDGVEVGNRFTSTILTALKASKCLVTIWSKTYFQSSWCVAEWRTFVERAQQEHLGADGLTVPVRLHDSEKFVKEFKALDFKNYNQSAPGWINTLNFVEFEQGVNELAARVYRVIQSAPEFRKEWTVIHPDQVQIDEEAFKGWAFRL
jgi:hypothetical protein